MATFFGDDSDTEQDQQESFFTQAPSRPVAGPSRAVPISRRETTADLDSGYDRSYQQRDDTFDNDFDEDGLDLQVEESENIVLRLSRRWMDERNSPELLQSDPNGDLDLCLQTLLRQQEAVNDLRTDIANWDEIEHLRLLLVQQDNERIRWLATSLIRCRIQKIEKHHLLLMNNDKYKERLSAEEIQYLERYDTLVTNLTHAQVLSLLPTKLHGFDEPGMIPEPELDQAVYAQARRTCGPVRLPDGRLLTLEKGSIHMLRYRSIREQLREGEVQLI